jgi:hypothetical protein
VITGSVVMGGQMDLGPSVGALTIGGDYTQEQAGTLNLKIGGASAATGYDQLTVAGQAVLSGTLSLTTVNGYTGTAGDTMAIVSAGTLSGQFGTVTGQSLGGGQAFTIGYSPSGATLTVGTTARAVRVRAVALLPEAQLAAPVATQPHWPQGRAG